ncbi:hypothetical protein DL89DRAFT_267638 [Linderina pennispora]|uniref:G-protein coupled receptors family 3 profile domain-containing protein n=1 Tax=Linderina pennispora TaxID=61395 RepID=A0A1Y1W8A4_9FUNG|nr:uncharacterized protein DL89DRAFT_267638 [Linderina pennispora]ORX69404.1 hypothetical protein DL89DRAFT_267638 [Linderina pennispora]
MAAVMDAAAQLAERSPSPESTAQGAAKLTFDVDPIGPMDKATIIVGACFYGFTFLVLVYAFVNRNYAPIRAKNLMLTALVFVGAVLWFVGDIATNGHVELIGVWSRCKVWCLWFRVFFAYTFSAAVGIRAYGLYCVFVLHRPYRGIGFYAPIVGLFVMLLIFCVTSQLISDEKTVMYVPELEMCTYVWGFRGACLGLLWLIWLFVFYFVFKIRNIHSSFNERWESIICCTLALGIDLFTTLMHTINPHYPLIMRYRVANTFFDFCMGNLVTLVMVFYPVVQCIFNREGYKREWMAKLQADGLRKEYKVSTDNPSTRRNYSVMDEEGDSNFQKEHGVLGRPEHGYVE